MPDDPSRASPALVALAAVVKERRAFLEVSQEGTAVHRNTIGNVERRTREPSLSTLLKLADALKMTGAELVAAVEAEMANPSNDSDEG